VTLWWSVTSDVLECAGCHELTVRRTENFSEWETADVEFYPPRALRRLPRWHHQLPHDIGTLFCEVYAAMHAGSRRLAMMGARTLIDMVAVDKVGDNNRTFPEKLKALTDADLVAEANSVVLGAAVEAGHAVTHRGHHPTAEQLDQVLDIVERLLQDVYVPWSEADQLKQIPGRPKR
jgi:hypothetical protein